MDSSFTASKFLSIRIPFGPPFLSTVFRRINVPAWINAPWLLNLSGYISKTTKPILLKFGAHNVRVSQSTHTYFHPHLTRVRVFLCLHACHIYLAKYGNHISWTTLTDGIAFASMHSQSYHIVLHKCACLNKCAPLTFEFVGSAAHRYLDTDMVHITIFSFWYDLGFDND